ncbi:MucBP domain-containing protein [Fructilactobacillus myrtifloralis]|uniref:MucBP domain-containing protein n=1 Tax=Fructilactobacillus myrtifloralis TaxID=2940301 RepID=A0ABY5BM77_9LACO|nr:MucBP domain-containing protein [Fructilactobacillus myrtifloralis]USS84619.1 MucBP domain-containing protein [Fructilactobacillus myrtifloralis]
MKTKKLIVTTMLTTTIASLGFIPTVVNPIVSQAATNVSKGKIIVHYVDQTGKAIRPATTATGATGTRYVADVPAIRGYSYSRIENGQNDNNGPEMVFGGGDGVTDVSEMTIVYTATGNSSKPTPVPGKATGTTATGENGQPQTSSKHGNEQAAQGTKPHANNQATGEKKQRAATKQGDNQQQTEQQTKAAKKKKAAKQQSKKQASKRNQHGIFMWGAAGLIGLAVVGGVAWKWLQKPRNAKH